MSPEEGTMPFDSIDSCGAHVCQGLWMAAGKETLSSWGVQFA